MTRHALVKASEKHGAGEWIRERLGSVLLLPLVGWGLWSAWQLSGAGLAGLTDWIALPVNALLLGGLLLVSLYHMHQGMTVIVDDYIHDGLRPVLNGLSALVCLAAALIGLAAIVSLALGVSPLSILGS